MTFNILLATNTGLILKPHTHNTAFDSLTTTFFFPFVQHSDHRRLSYIYL